METGDIKTCKGVFLIKAEDIIIRKWQENDAVGVRNVLKLSWEKAYSSFIPQTDLDLYLDKTYSESLLRNMFNNPDFICYVAQFENTICGWLKLTMDKSEYRFYISSIYVLPEFQGMKIGDKLFNIACEEAARNNYKEIYIGVMTQNAKALKWYQNLGFKFNEEKPFIMGRTSVPHLIGSMILNK